MCSRGTPAAAMNVAAVQPQVVTSEVDVQRARERRGSLLGTVENHGAARTGEHKF